MDCGSIVLPYFKHLYIEGMVRMYKQNKELWRILESTGLKRETLTQEGHDFTDREWNTLTQLFRLEEEEDENILYRIMKKQYEYYKEKEEFSLFPEHYLQLLFFLTEAERRKGDVDAADEYADEALEYVILMDMPAQQSTFFFQKFRNMEVRKKGVMEPEDFKYIRLAYAVEKLFIKDDKVRKMIELYLSEHYEKDVLGDIR